MMSYSISVTLVNNLVESRHGVLVIVIVKITCFKVIVQTLNAMVI